MKEILTDRAEHGSTPRNNFLEIQDGNLIHRVKEVTDEKLVLELEFRGMGMVETGIYYRLRIPEFDFDFFVLDREKSDSGVLPHGSACYLAEWDFILVTAGTHGLLDLTKESLSSHEYTVLAHELGHREDNKTTDAKTRRLMSYGEKEIRAWEHAKRLFGHNQKFDHAYADRDIESYRE